MKFWTTFACAIAASSLYLTFEVISGQTILGTTCSQLYKYSTEPYAERYEANILETFASLEGSNAYNTSTHGDPNPVFALFQCRGDQSSQICSACASAAIDSLNTTCVTRNSTKGGRVQLDFCFLRYEDHIFFANYSAIDSPLTNCSSRNNNASTREFDLSKEAGFSFLVDQVPKSIDKFVVAQAGSSSNSSVYLLGQCVPDLTSSDCQACLGKAQASLSTTCAGNNGGASYLAECMVQYENYKFFSGSPLNVSASSQFPSSSSSGISSSKVIGISVGVGAFILLLTGCFVARLLHVRRSTRSGDKDELQLTLHRGPIKFSYEMLKRCTGDFDDSHKLGEGGFGAVFKGFFQDGTEVAIKKLSIASKQGEQQFLNEVQAISSVQHRNLVRLLGCSMEGSERLLVYEFLRNNSLERALFGERLLLLDDLPLQSGEEASTAPGSGKIELPWARRCSILLGTARGLAYLHEDSQIRIIHRDIKPSNILLDDVFEAKISDFGLARLYEGNEAWEVITTKVAGTYGYMAPEYAFHGHLSEKADVFSFGIVVLETVSGKRNRQQCLVDMAWQLHGEQQLWRLIDPEMPREGVLDAQVVHFVEVAMMCTQASPQDRPSMTHVVAMLSGHSNAQVRRLIRSASIDGAGLSLTRLGGTSSSGNNSALTTSSSDQSSESGQRQWISDVSSAR